MPLIRFVNAFGNIITEIRTAGTDYLACALLDVVIDNFLYLIGQLGDIN
jgi:hypothetical protein